MGTDKSLLPVLGRPMIEQVLAQLQPHFEQVLISANDPVKFAFLGVRIVADQVPGWGPLMGIGSALEASGHDLNFVVACDMPRIEIPWVRQLLRGAANFDCVVPVNARGQVEPLLAVYRKSALAAIWMALRCGQRKITDALDRCRVNYVRLRGIKADEDCLYNVNTPRDYTDLLSKYPPLAAKDPARQAADTQRKSRRNPVRIPRP